MVCNIDDFKANNARNAMKEKYQHVISKIFEKGCYIFGAKCLGRFAQKECEKNSITVYGFVSNEGGNTFLPDILNEEDCVIVASIYHVDICKQLAAAGVKNYIYYECLAQADERFRVYHETAFLGIFDEMEKNGREYEDVYSLLEDDLSKEIYQNILKYRMTFDTEYTIRAHELSEQEGKPDLDNVILRRLEGESPVFFDIGGFDGQSTIDFIEKVKNYKKVYFFEPDESMMIKSRNRLSANRDIEYIQAGVGAIKGLSQFDNFETGGGCVSAAGRQTIRVVSLDEFITPGLSYIKMDIEGAEMDAICGAEQFIKEKHPLLSVSVYHRLGDIHHLTKKILEFNSQYHIYIRHYTDRYDDTRIYFV